MDPKYPKPKPTEEEVERTEIARKWQGYRDSYKAHPDRRLERAYEQAAQKLEGIRRTVRVAERLASREKEEAWVARTLDNMEQEELIKASMEDSSMSAETSMRGDMLGENSIREDTSTSR